ncbi:MAG: hypothetical protein NTY46_15340 [Candidatus Sumerlaeota bacterium]|nr:hypothetical protein [Candidatus Sumerlaeota bacterium]
MRDVDKGITRRGFITSVGMAGLGSILTLAAGSVAAAESAETSAPAIAAIPKGAKLATRKFGKTDVDVSILSLGGMFNILSNQIMLKKCLDWGLTYWDTADCWSNR